MLQCMINLHLKCFKDIAQKIDVKFESYVLLFTKIKANRSTIFPVTFLNPNKSWQKNNNIDSI